MKTVIAMCGIPGAGKTTVAGYITENIDCPVINTDVLRSLYPGKTGYFPEGDRAFDDFFYGEIGKLMDNHPVIIIDATYHTMLKRRRLVRFCGDRDSHLIWCLCRAEQQTILCRLLEQERLGTKCFRTDVKELVDLYFDSFVPPLAGGDEGDVVDIKTEGIVSDSPTAKEAILKNVLDCLFADV